jgi:hypothetical protein
MMRNIRDGEVHVNLTKISCSRIKVGLQYLVLIDRDNAYKCMHNCTNKYK